MPSYTALVFGASSTRCTSTVKNKMKSNIAISSAILAAVLLLTACGSQDQSAASVAPSAKAAISVKASAANGGFLGARSNYAITKTGTGFTVVDFIGKDGTTNVDSSVGVLKFTDLTVNLAIGAKAASISPADLKTLTELYIAYFNRVPDADGLGYWVDQFKAGQSLEDIGKSFYEAAVQFSTLTGYTATMTNADFVKVIYKNVLGRTTVDADGLNYWSSKIADGTETRGTLVKSILASAHTFKGNATYGYVADLLDNKGTVANYFAVQQGLGYNTAAESIVKGIAIAAAVTPTSTRAASLLVGVVDPAFNLAPDCLAPAVLNNGVCQQRQGASISPSVNFNVAVAQSGNSYTAQLCHPGSAGCEALNQPIFVSAADYLESKGEVVASVALANQVVDEFNRMIGRLWLAKTVPSTETLLAVFRNAIASGIASGSASTAIATAGSGFAAAGFSAAAGTSSGSTGSSTTAATSTGAGACNVANYRGPNDDPQFDSFCQNAFFNTCMDKATGTTTYASQTVSVCKVLDGTLKATGGGSAVQYCSYCR